MGTTEAVGTTSGGEMLSVRHRRIWASLKNHHCSTVHVSS